MTTYSTTSRTEAMRSCTDLFIHSGFSTESSTEPSHIHMLMVAKSVASEALLTLQQEMEAMSALPCRREDEESMV